MLHTVTNHRTLLTVEVTGGLDGVLRVASMLRARRYRVLSLESDVTEGLLRCELETGDPELLLARLERMPAVLTATAEARQHALSA